MTRNSRIVYRLRYPLSALLVVITILFFLSYPKITRQSDYVSYFPQEDPIVSSLGFIMDNFQGGQRLNLTLKAPSGAKNYFLYPEVLKTVSSLEEKLRSYNNIQNVSSFPSVLRELNEMNSGVKEIPESRGLILVLSRYMKAFNASSETGVSRMMINDDYSQINLTIMIFNHDKKRFLSETGLRELADNIRMETSEFLGADFDYDLWGYDLEYLHMAETISKDQIKTTSLSIILVLVVASFFFKSFFYGLLTLIPLLSGIMLNFTFMAWFGIPLDVTTSMVTSVAIGVGVDDAIHYLIQFRAQLKEGGTVEDILFRCARTAGRPIALTTVSIVAGLLVLTMASFKAIAYFGILVSVTLTFAMIGTLVILPAILSILVKARLLKN